MRRNNEEEQLHLAAVNLLRTILPPDAVLHHSHNEGKRSRADAVRAKAMGQRAGFSDLIILLRGVVYFIEFKSATGRQSDNQKDFQADIAATGFPHYAIVRSIEDLVQWLRVWDVPHLKVGNAGALQRSASGRR